MLHVTDILQHELQRWLRYVLPDLIRFNLGNLPKPLLFSNRLVSIETDVSRSFLDTDSLDLL